MDMAVDLNALRDPFPLTLHQRAEIDASHILHENVDRRIPRKGNRLILVLRIPVDSRRIHILRLFYFSGEHIILAVQLPVVQVRDTPVLHKDAGTVICPPQADPLDILLVLQGRVVEYVAIALSTLFHTDRKVIHDRFGQIPEILQQSRLRHGRQFSVCLFPDVGCELHLRDRRILADHFLELFIFFCKVACLREQRVVVIRSHIRRQLVVVVRSVHEAEVRSALKHIDINMPHVQHIVQILRALRVAMHMAAVSPVVKPADPEFRTHQRAALGIRCEHSETLLRARTKISGRMDPVKAAAGKRLLKRTVRGDERHRHAALQHHVTHRFHIAGVITVIPVFVLNLHQDHRTALRDLKRRDQWKQPVIILSDMPQERLVVRPQTHPVLLQQPCRQPAELPLRADIGRRTQYHI